MGKILKRLLCLVCVAMITLPAIPAMPAAAATPNANTKAGRIQMLEKEFVRFQQMTMELGYGPLYELNKNDRGPNAVGEYYIKAVTENSSVKIYFTVRSRKTGDIYSTLNVKSTASVLLREAGLITENIAYQHKASSRSEVRVYLARYADPYFRNTEIANVLLGRAKKCGWSYDSQGLNRDRKLVTVVKKGAEKIIYSVFIDGKGNAVFYSAEKKVSGGKEVVSVKSHKTTAKEIAARFRQQKK